MFLTTQQQRIVDYIRRFKDEEGQAPSYSEIAGYLGIHKGAVQWHLEALVKKGALRREKGRHRSLEVAEVAGMPVAMKHGDRSARIFPLLGCIVAGLPEEEREDRGGLDPIHFLTQGNEQCYLLRVRGDSMIEAHIQEGDLVAVDTQRRPRNGDIVVALVDGENTLKYLRQKGSTTWLEAANPNMPRQIIGQEGQIQGVVIGLLRQI